MIRRVFLDSLCRIADKILTTVSAYKLLFLPSINSSRFSWRYKKLTNMSTNELFYHQERFSQTLRVVRLFISDWDSDSINSNACELLIPKLYSLNLLKGRFSLLMICFIRIMRRSRTLSFVPDIFDTKSSSSSLVFGTKVSSAEALRFTVPLAPS